MHFMRKTAVHQVAWWATEIKTQHFSLVGKKPQLLQFVLKNLDLLANNLKFLGVVFQVLLRFTAATDQTTEAPMGSMPCARVPENVGSFHAHWCNLGIPVSWYSFF